MTSQLTKTAEETIHHLASAYNDLCIVMKRLEGTFGIALILLMSSCLLHMVMAPNNTISASCKLHNGMAMVLMLFLVLPEAFDFVFKVFIVKKLFVQQAIGL